MKNYILITLFTFLITSGLGQDSAIVSASNHYESPNVIKRVLVGKNYRAVWSMPVKMKVFDIDVEKGGLKITELGGGQQTKSLRMKDKKGLEWVLRTVDKTVKKALPKFLRNTFAEKIVQDMISSAYPYAPLTVGFLAKTLQLAAPDPELFFIPDDTRFGKNRSIFANTVCMLELTDPTFDQSDAKSTDDIYKKIKAEQDIRVDGKMLLKARLLDMLIADWDRHKLQWKWGIQKNDKGTIVYPIPRDRDQAFFLSNGLLVKVVRPFTMKHMVGFTDNDKKLVNLSKKAWSFDKRLLSELDAPQWQAVISDFQKTLSDEVLEKALKQLPPEVYAKDGTLLFDKLKKRRDGLMEYGMKYYAFLSSEVIVTGTDKDDVFNISKQGKDIVVTAYDDKGKKTERYQRVFKKEETKKISIELLEGSDQFNVDEAVDSPIRVVLVGEQEKVKMNVKGKMKVSREKKQKSNENQEENKEEKKKS